MHNAPDWSVHVIGWNITGDEVCQHAEDLERIILSHLLPCHIRVDDRIGLQPYMDPIVEVAKGAKVLFSFPTEQGLTARPTIPVRIEIRSTIPESRFIDANRLRIGIQQDIRKDLESFIQSWPDRNNVPVLVTII